MYLFIITTFVIFSFPVFIFYFYRSSSEFIFVFLFFVCGQLYMENIHDLLNPVNDNISIVEDPKTGDVSLPGATLVEVRGHQSFMELLRVGEAHRIAANTKLNTESSRSHAILMVIFQDVFSL